MNTYSVSTKRSVVVAVVALTVAIGTQYAKAQPGSVLSHQKISDTQGGFKGILDDDDFFGNSVVSLGDLDGDGVGDLAVGARLDNDGSAGPCDNNLVCNRGAVWILFLNPDGTVKKHQKISDTQGGFTGKLDDNDRFGGSVASMGDLDGDGVTDLAVGATGDDDGGGVGGSGSVWILFLNTNGTVKSHQKISSTQGGFSGTLNGGDHFGSSLTLLGDLDEDGVSDLAVGAYFDDESGNHIYGAVWILFLNPNSTVKSHQKINSFNGGFTGILSGLSNFGVSVASLGDLDGDGVGDLAVGAFNDGDGGCCFRGAVWILFLNTDGTVKKHQKISDTEGGFTGILDAFDQFGTSLASLGDLDEDGVTDLAVGAFNDDDGGPSRGAVWLLFLNTDGTVKKHQKISDTKGGFTNALNDCDQFGRSVTLLGDHDRDGKIDLAVGAQRDDDGGKPPFANRGAVWVLFLDDGSCPWDLDNSGSVGTSDLLELFAQWGTDGPADFDGSGVINTNDLLILFANWGPCK